MRVLLEACKRCGAHPFCSTTTRAYGYDKHIIGQDVKCDECGKTTQYSRKDQICIGTEIYYQQEHSEELPPLSSFLPTQSSLDLDAQEFPNPLRLNR